MKADFSIEDACKALGAQLQEPYAHFAEPLLNGPKTRRRKAVNQLVSVLMEDGREMHRGRFSAASEAKWDLWWTLVQAALQLRAAIWARRESEKPTEWSAMRLKAVKDLVS